MKPAVEARAQGAPGVRGDADDTSLESFVAHLHSEGVAAGQREAERLIREAREQAAAIMSAAAVEAEAVLARAKEQAAGENERARAELQLAARDTLLQLHGALERTLTQLLERGVGGALANPEQLAGLVRDVVAAYARDDAQARPVAIYLPQTTSHQLETWTAQLVAAGLRDDARVAATLHDAGFEYRLNSGATVEISVASVVEHMMELLRPALREALAGATDPQRTPSWHERSGSTIGAAS